MTITIDLPDALAERLRADAEAQGTDLAALARDAVVAFYDAYDDEEGEPDPDLIAALREGIAERDAGDLRTLEQVDAAAQAVLDTYFGRADKAA